MKTLLCRCGDFGGIGLGNRVAVDGFPQRSGYGEERH